MTHDQEVKMPTCVGDERFSSITLGPQDNTLAVTTVKVTKDEQDPDISMYNFTTTGILSLFLTCN